MAATRWRRMITGLAAYAVGTVAALFLAGPALFADGAFRERVGALVIAVLVFTVLGLAAGARSPESWRTSGVVLGFSMLPVAVSFGLDQRGNPPFLALVLGFVVGAFAAALGGALLGSRLATRRS